MEKVELLAPAGGMEALRAAVENGADAVYLGGRLFNARQYASNFGEEELKEAVSYAHKRGVKIYVTMNISLKQEELKEVREYLDTLYDMGVDALIIQDLGLCKLIKESHPDFPIHASTQMTIHNSYGVNHLERAGFSRAVLSRELSYGEIEEIAKNTDLELEVFVHGALCVSYSGQCLMSSMIGGRSGNRGTCAQTCRMPFSVERSIVGRKLESKGDYLLSPKDLNTVDDIGKLIDMGVKSFKIEGRMKKPEYVAVVVEKYRKAIDNHISKSESAVTEGDKFELEQMFNRGFTKGMIGGDFGSNFISQEKSNNRGIYLGEVLGVKGRNVTVRLQSDVALQDGLSIDSKDGENKSATIDRIYLSRKAVSEAKCGELATLDLYAKVVAGDKLYKIYDKKLSDKAKMSYQNIEEEKLPLDLTLEIAIGEKPLLKAIFQGEEFSVTVEKTVEVGIKSSLTREKTEEQIGKFGNSDYRLNSLELKLDEGSFLPVSVLNELRRDLIEKIDRYRTKTDNRVSEAVNPFLEKMSESFEYDGIKLSAKVENLEQVKFLDLEKLSRVYLPIQSGLKEEIESIKSSGIEIYISTDRIVMDSELEKLKREISEIESEVDGILVGNIGTFDCFRGSFKDLKLQADLSFNIFNSESAEYLSRFGASGVTLSPELNFKEVSELTESYGFEYEALAYGHLQLMTMKHCPMSLFKNCGEDRDCESCQYREGYEMVDRKDMKFRLRRHNDITTIYNSQRLFIPEHIRKLESSNISYARLEFTNEKSEIRDIVSLYADVLDGTADRGDIERYIEEMGDKANFTKGHYFRGTI